ncbi:MAG: hypothetical protein JW994_06865 [Candidatus Omnitrophica bacterium]|nr:hypothetical protein [Candidatus Omnitrophota bacterium]
MNFILGFIGFLRRKAVVSATLAFFILFFTEYNAYAFKINIDPPRVEVNIAAGTEEGGTISVFNYAEYETMHVKVYVNDLVYLPDGSNDFLPEGTTPWSISDWIKVGPTEFDLLPSEETKVRYVVNIPQNAKGGRYGVVFFEVSPPLEDFKGKSGATINIRLGSIFLLTAKGTEKYDGELQDLKVDTPDKNGEFDVLCTIKNNGNVLIRPVGTVKIIDSSKAELYELKLNQGKTGVLPDTNKQFLTRYTGKKLSPGEYVAQAIIDFGGKDYLGGQTTFKIE